MSRTLNRIEESLFHAICAGAAITGCVLLILILTEITLRALPSLSWYFMMTPESATPHIGMGIANAIWGSIIISLLATILAIPLAMGTAVYLQKYAGDNQVTKSFRFFIEVLSGTPAIVIGIFGLLIFVYYLRPLSGGFSLISGSIALAILIIPVIERSIEEAIHTVPFELEEGSYALGATKWQTIYMVVLPTAISGIITGAILGFGRAAEESAVVILTAGYSQFMPEFTIKSNQNLLFGIKVYPIQDLIGTLPYSVWHSYENSNVIPVSNGFAAAFILIIFIILVNFFGKITITRIIPGQGRSDRTGKNLTTVFAGFINRLRKKTSGDPENPTMRMARVTAYTGSPPGMNDEVHNAIPEMTPKITPSQMTLHRLFLRTLLPFTPPALLLGIIAFLAPIPPLHHALGPASPSLAGLFGTGLALIITVAGLIFGLLLAKKGGAFRGKTRRVGYAGVAAGFCLVCIAGLICSSAAADIFSTGADPAPTASEDRNAKLAALLASGEPGADQPDGSEIQVQAQPAVAPTSPATLQGNSTTGSIPRKNALSVGESYWYGDAQHTCRATVYDYKVLPFYFWWWIDYNRFVPQIPPVGKSYLVIFVRIENVGTQSAIIPSADRFNVSYNGYSSGRLPYLNTSLISTWQYSQLGAENRREQYYQWIREIGQDKRDYAYLTGENLFKNGNSTTWGNETTTITTSTTGNTTNTSAYNGAFLKPGQSQTVDGYLIFLVPDAATKDLNNTYVDVAFNSLSRARWKLG